MKRLLLLCAFALAACTTTSKATNDGPSAPQKTAGDFYPLGIGTRWTYEVKLLGESRLIEVTTLRKTSDGFVEDSTGAQFLVDGFGVRDQKRYLLRNPIAAGTKWTNVSRSPRSRPTRSSPPTSPATPPPESGKAAWWSRAATGWKKAPCWSMR